MRSRFKWIFTLLLALTVQFSFAQEKTITGVVTDGTSPIPGANVVIKGTNKGVTTGFDGSYSIKAREGDVLVYSFMGTKDVSKTVGSSNVINTTLQDDTKQLVEVVVQGYRTVTKKTAVTSSATINSKTIENRPNANAINTLQGQLAGVNITASTGQPGAKSSVVIRGLGTINGNTDPLYVIDGFPSNSDNFRSINPNDIEKVDVLKDAAAIAEYGARGSNGVIVIKTKKGNFGEQKTTFKYSSQFGITELQKSKYSYANSKELLRLERTFGSGWGGTYPPTGLPITDSEIDAFNVQTDWVNYFLTRGTSTSHNLSIQNDGKNTNAFTSLNYFNQEGILKSTGLKRFTLRNNISGKTENEKFKFGVNTSFGYSKNNEATNLGTGAINRNYITGAYLSAPYISPSDYQSPTQLFQLYANSGGSLLYTPLFLVDKLNQYENLTDEIRADLATDFSYKLTKDLTARVRTSGELLSTRFHQAEYPRSFNALLFNAAGTASVLNSINNNSPFVAFDGFEDINQTREFLFNNLWQLDYAKTLGKHTFDFNLNAEYNHSRIQTNNLRQRGLDIKTFVPNTGSGYVADLGTNDFYVPQVSAGQLRNDLISYFGSFDYDYNKRYGFVASVRRDGSSRFIGDRQWGNFWSLGARWNLEEENFMKSLSFINIFKIRGSIGTVGNQRIIDGSIYAGTNPPRFADIYSNAPAANNYNGNQSYAINFGYPDLRWETTKTYNVGVDFEMFSARLRGAFDHYNKKTIDLFISEPVVPAVGAIGNIITKNSDAIITNKGYELNLAYDLIKNNEKGITLTIRANGSYNKNEVSNIKTGGGKISIVQNGVTFVHQNGGMLFEPYVYHYIGVNPANGNLLFEDINGNPTETPTNSDRKATGKSFFPQYQGGFGFDFDYKGFFVSSTFTYAQKVWRFDTDLANLYDTSNIGTFVVTNDLLNAWTTSNTGTDVPSLTATNKAADVNSDRFLRDASYIRLRNAQIGYKVPKKFLDKTFIKDLSFTLQGENLLNITKWKGFDPESSRQNDFYNYPTAKLFTFGMDIKF